MAKNNIDQTIKYLIEEDPEMDPKFSSSEAEHEFDRALLEKVGTEFESMNAE